MTDLIIYILGIIVGVLVGLWARKFYDLKHCDGVLKIDSSSDSKDIFRFVLNVDPDVIKKRTITKFFVILSDGELRGDFTDYNDEKTS